jgi:hypothetical protein
MKNNPSNPDDKKPKLTPSMRALIQREILLEAKRNPKFKKYLEQKMRDKQANKE